MKQVVLAGLMLAIASKAAPAQVNAGEQKSDTKLPFTVTRVTSLRLPWRIAFLPDGRMLITEKVGGLALVSQDGTKVAVANVPAVDWNGQGGMLGVYLSPHYSQDHMVYLTYSEPGEFGSSLALARAQLKIDKDASSPERRLRSRRMASTCS
jgi:glucose/arabinose dehydrogenase